MNDLSRHGRQAKSHPPTIEHPLRNPFLDLHQEVSKAMNEFYNIFEPGYRQLGRLVDFNLSPSIDIIEDKDHFKIEAEMPGMDEKDISISIDENALTIRGEKSSSKQDEKKNYLSREINYGLYERTIALPQSVDPDKATASFKKGMLWITLPKKAGASGKAREVRIEKA